MSYKRGHQRTGGFTRSPWLGGIRYLIQQQFVAQSLDCNPVTRALYRLAGIFGQRTYGNVTRKVTRAVVARHR